MAAEESLRWIGTKFHPHASVKGCGTDCKGFVWGVARELGFPEAESFYATFVNYDLTRRGGLPHAMLREGMASLFDPVEAVVPGDVLLLNMDGRPCHLGIASRELNGVMRVVHAQIAPRNRVKETRIDALLSVYSLDSVWRWRSV